MVIQPMMTKIRLNLSHKRELAPLNSKLRVTAMKEANLNSSPPEPGTTLLSAAHVETTVGR
ncbi:hypothetical protein MTR_7g069785 [Medicago truncatula]|uniref:Uncharacterized protein n=1 Tax=Medicago truncatula TaxID=3880 RepID=A0A072U0B3_MEDTR|nr:hypothetical protein MTR_7g069785 [Medicago truncatula]